MIGAARAAVIAEKGVGTPPAFSPADIAGMLFWHDSVLSTLTLDSGVDVISWEDLSGNARPWTQSAGSTAPHTRTDNGRLLVDFDGSAQFMSMTGHGIDTALHFFWVGVIDAYASAKYLIEAGALTDTNDGFHLRQSPTTDKLFAQLSDGTTPRDTLTSSGTFTPGTACVIELFFNGSGTFGIGIDGSETTGTASNGGCSGPDSMALMAQTSGGNPVNGAMAVSLAYDAPVTGDDLTDLRTYLAAIAADINA